MGARPRPLQSPWGSELILGSLLAVLPSADLPPGRVPVQQYPVQAAGVEVRRRGRLWGQLGRKPGGVR